jgi:hypothetical protein
MRQFAEQVRQVGIVYGSGRGSLGWLLGIGLAVIMLYAFFRVEAGNDQSPMVLFYATMFAIWFSNLISDQVKLQFAHSRARLIPGFAGPHIAVPVALTLLATIALPLLIARLSLQEGLACSAMASLAIGLLLLARLYSRLFVVFIPIYLAIWLSKDLGVSIQGRPVYSILLLICGWLGIAFYFFKLCHLAEDDTAYRKLSDETLKVAAAGGEEETRAKYRNAARWSAISDRWQAQIGGFHQDRTIRIIRLLRYGFGATPVEFTAIGWAIFMTIIVGWMVHDADDPYDTTRSTSAIFLIVPTLFACMAPIAVAGGAIGWRVPRLRNEILFPLTRRELIDDLLLTAAWHSLVIWLLGCACGTGILLYALPVEAKTVSLFATAAFLTAAVAVAAYGLSLHIVMFEVKAAQFFVLGLFVLGVIFLMCAWWSSRKEMGDAPYWVMAAMVMGVGAMMTYTGRTAWLNQEFG